ncbi:uncharacterized protein LOC123531552 [Mercenaria mercenaria]|uniref:uncharacterized protein LOC123531552 n=1 Tax=Mercenaria mercenaria TaxID=6596 RepID=UPI00234E4CC2|nr:uncharacterized protein LOC123531552 [Mercenaria mercenaria]XP_045168548.2 uncharacterized protein LOC123531552 [Mercenaria mercenaria]XP_045168551.2 uncharacterized protein LOC123531552 [Mercenaria mercenaria]XP_053374393.1 uncharacterized protein LOC123531552 [Mercenaria mercenaria]XP_053374394.1 uncharacterized protein LOC123531552 [Mercenaria mercenaria]
MRYFHFRRNRRVALLLLLVVTWISITSYTRESERQTLIQNYLLDNQWLLTANDNNLVGKRNQSCVHPNLPLWNTEIENHITFVDQVRCSKEPDWVYTGNGRFYISLSAVKKHGEIKCSYQPIVNENEEFKILDPHYPMLNGSTLVSDAFKVSCTASNGNKYSNMHACIAPQPSRMSRDYSPRSENFNVLMLGLDSVSRHMYMRLLPKTHKYFTEVLGGSLLEGYNIVGDGTTQALMPLLTGKRETEIPETRRGKAGARYVDELLEFIWKRYEKKGYVTQWAEDTPESSAFNLRLLGFKTQPVIHYMRPFYLASAQSKSIFSFLFKNQYCFGSKISYKIYLDWLKEGLETNKANNFFSAGFISEYSHNNNRDLMLIDKHNVQFLKYLKNHNILENTFVIVMSDHGLRYGSFRMTEQGKLEERMPYFGVYAPKRFRTKFPVKYKALVENTKRLVVPSDIHKTLLEIIDEKGEETERSVYSLFSPIPETRTCSDAGIDAHWCACLKTQSVSVSHPNIIASAQKILSVINEMLEDFTSQCYSLSLQKILKAASLETDTNVLKFKRSADRDGRVADLSDTLDPVFVHYLVTFETVPGSAVFEASALMNVKTGHISAREKEISRLNSYNDAPKCVEKSYPALRPYCFCR